MSEVLTLIILVATAITSVGAATFLIARQIIRPIIRAEIDRHLGPNGHEDLLPPRERGQSLRTLVVWSRQDLARIDERLKVGSDWMDGHETDHVMRDQTWPRRRALG